MYEELDLSSDEEDGGGVVVVALTPQERRAQAGGRTYGFTTPASTAVASGAGESVSGAGHTSTTNTSSVSSGQEQGQGTRGGVFLPPVDASDAAATRNSNGGSNRHAEGTKDEQQVMDELWDAALLSSASESSVTSSSGASERLRETARQSGALSTSTGSVAAGSTTSVHSHHTGALEAEDVFVSPYIEIDDLMASDSEGSERSGGPRAALLGSDGPGDRHGDGNDDAEDGMGHKVGLESSTLSLSSGVESTTREAIEQARLVWDPRTRAQIAAGTFSDSTGEPGSSPYDIDVEHELQIQAAHGNMGDLDGYEPDGQYYAVDDDYYAYQNDAANDNSGWASDSEHAYENYPFPYPDVLDGGADADAQGSAALSLPTNDWHMDAFDTDEALGSGSSGVSLSESFSTSSLNESAAGGSSVPWLAVPAQGGTGSDSSTSPVGSPRGGGSSGTGSGAGAGSSSGAKRRKRRKSSRRRQKVKDWNAEFQDIIDGLEKTSEDQATAMYNRLRHLAHDFVAIAKRYGEIIISEYCLPDEQKTIRPVSIGGQAGGDKYICQNILFKFAIDRGLYNGDEYAAKAAGHDLKGLMSYFNVRTPDIHLPLMALIDYRGFRLIALSFLPIQKETIIYGSCDAKEIHASDHRFNTIMSQFGKRLNLKGHRVGHPSNACTIHGPGDIEGHLGTDGRYYLIDFARLMPPEPPRGTGFKGGHLFRLLRPELVKLSSVPLSSDAFTRFGQHNNHIHNEEVRQATKLRDHVLIPEFARWLDSQPDAELQQLRLSELMHRKGINVRCCGRVRACSTSVQVRKLLLQEMVVRTIKNTLREVLRMRMRENGMLSEEPYHHAVVSYLNLVLGNHTHAEASRAYWVGDLKPRLVRHFVYALNSDELLPEYDLRATMDLYSVFHRLQGMCGITFSDEALRELRESSREFEFVDPDIQKIEATVKHMNLIAHAEGSALYIQAMQRSGKEGERLLKRAVEKFREAIQSSPDNFVTLHQWGNALFRMAMMREANLYSGADVMQELRVMESFFREAELKFQEALQISSTAHEVQYSWGNMKLAHAIIIGDTLGDTVRQGSLLESAGEHYERAFALHPAYQLRLHWLADLENRKQLAIMVHVDQQNARYAFEPYQGSQHRRQTSDGGEELADLDDLGLGLGGGLASGGVSTSSSSSSLSSLSSGGRPTGHHGGHGPFQHPHSPVGAMWGGGGMHPSLSSSSLASSSSTNSLSSYLDESEAAHQQHRHHSMRVHGVVAPMGSSSSSSSSFVSENDGPSSGLGRTTSMEPYELYVVDLCHLSEFVDDKLIENLALNNNEMRILRVHHCRNLTDRSIEALSECCPELEELRVSNCEELTSTAMHNLLANCYELQSLDVSGCTGLGPEFLVDVTMATSQLRVLRADRVPLTDAALCKVGQSTEELRVLMLNGCRDVTDDGMLAVAATNHKLRVLHLARCRSVSNKCIGMVAQHCWQDLVELNLDSCRITDEGINALVYRKVALRTLVLSKCTGITDVALIALSRQMGSTLTSLDLSSCRQVADKGVSQIASNCTQLRMLRLDDCVNVSNVSVAEVCTQCTELRVLSLSKLTRVSDAGIMPLATHCQHLHELDLGGMVKVTNAAILAIADGHCQLTKLVLEGCVKVSDEAVSAVAVFNPMLTSLNIRMCELVTDNAISALALNCPQLRSLHLEMNYNVTNMSIVQVASHCRALQHLSINRCKHISDIAIDAVATYCSLLRTLNLKANRNISGVSIVRIIEECRWLRTLILEGVKNLDDTVLISIVENGENLAKLSLDNNGRFSQDVRQMLIDGRPGLQVLRW